MSNIKKPGGEDEKSEYLQQQEAKESAALNMHTAAKVAFRGADWHARDAERDIEQSKRPMKDMPHNMPPTGDIRADHAHDGVRKEGKADPHGDDDAKNEGGDEDEGTQDGRAGKGGKGGGGKRPSPDLTLESTYKPFADSPTKSQSAKQNNADQENKESSPENEANLPVVENQIGASKPAAPKSASPKAALGATIKASGPKSGNSGGKSGPSSGPSL